MSTLVTGAVQSDTFKNKAGTREYGRCTAWVNFNGTGTVAIRDSLNVSSITDNGTGKYTVNFEQNMNDTNYSVTGGVSKFDSNNDANTHINFGTTTLLKTISYVPVALGVGSGAGSIDSPMVSIQIFGGDA